MNNSLGVSSKEIKWQTDCDNLIKNKDCVILSSPTGTGKTKRYENWAFNKPERPIFITSPIKALSNQKFRDLYARGYKVGLETGDVKYFPFYNCDIICCTQEIYNNRYREYKNSTLVIDEFSYIFEDEQRSRCYIDSLYYSKAKNIMLCSATFGNPIELKNYIDGITKRDFFLYDNKERLTPLSYKGELKKSYIRDSLVVAYSKSSCEIIMKNLNRYEKYNLLKECISKYGMLGNLDGSVNNKASVLEN